MFRLTADKVAKGLTITQPGRYLASEPLVVSAPLYPEAEGGAWGVVRRGRPCVLLVKADDVTLDLDFHALANSTELVGGLVLVCVAEGCRSVRVVNAVLGFCAVGILFEEGCQGGAVRMTTCKDFSQKAVLAYAPVGLELSDLVLGPNLSQLTESQETSLLKAYGPHVTPAGLGGWVAFHDNLPLEEQSHVCGVCVAPSATQEGPYPQAKNAGSGVVLERVHVASLTMHFRNHSMLVSVTDGGAVRKARGRLGEALPDWYKLRWHGSTKGAPLRFFPSLEACERQQSFVTYAGGFLMNAGALPQEEEVTEQIAGVDRHGDPLRGVQALLFVGCGQPELTAVTAEMPVLKTLTPRVLPCSRRGCQLTDRTVSRVAARLVVLTAPESRSAETEPAPPCCSREGAAAQFSQFRSTNTARPVGVYVPTARGSLSGG